MISPDKQSLNQRLRPFLGSLVGVLLVLGGGMLLRAYFVENPPSFSPLASQDTGVLPQNPPLSIAGISISNKEPVPVWGNSIPSVLDLPASQGVWVESRSQDAIHLGEIIGSAYTPAFTLPENTLGYRLYSSRDLLYFTTPNGPRPAQLMGVENGAAQLVYAAAQDQIIADTYFEPVNKSFYILEFDQRQTYTIKLVKPNGTQQELYISRTLGDIKLVYLNPSSQELYLHATKGSTNGCFVLSLTDKAIRDFDCNLVRVHSGTSNVYVSTPAPKDLNIGSRSRVLRVNVESGAESRVWESEVGQIATNLYYLSPVATVVLNQLNVATDVSWEPIAIVRFDIRDGKELARIEGLPPGQVLQAALSTEQTGALVLKDLVTGGQVLYTYADQEIGWQSTSLAGCTLGCEYKFIDYTAML